jgi:hypothetical protein
MPSHGNEVGRYSSWKDAEKKVASYILANKKSIIETYNLLKEIEEYYG